ncbi:MAG: tRNA (guanine(46)-N(7))-methyltransferase TrmB [Pseudomonadota bacterium]|nr:tRNA (guanine(46)-N(7))-methyltransferase TrmB [Pseudomonadota bacterium]
MGEDRPSPGAAVSLRSLRPPPPRLYGRGRGHALRPRQQRLLDETLPRIAFHPEQAANPLAAFGPCPRELWLEVGFGGGEHTLAQVTANPEAGLIACEVFANGICSLLSRLVPDGAEANAALPANLRLWADDARTLLRDLPDASVDRLFLLFPDPWPKTRHAKRRFVHPALLPMVARVLKQGAEWRVASDDPTYQAWVGDVMSAQDLFARPCPLASRPTSWPATRYETKALRAGRVPRYWCFIRR